MKLTVVPRRGERLDPRTVRLLSQISGLIAVAAQLDDANRAVEEARARVVEVRQEERRLLRRELDYAMANTGCARISDITGDLLA